MSLSTHFAITTRGADWGHVLIEARRIIGIPVEHPLTARTDSWGDIEVCSTPGGFSSALIVKYRDGLPVTTGCDEQPVTFVQVAFDSQYGTDVDPFVLHRRATLELGAWCDAYGLEWWTCDEPLLGAPYRGWVKGEPVWPNYSEATA